MDSRTEGRILRLAIARGLLRWDDLDAVADQLPEPGEDPPSGGHWLPMLLESGRLEPAQVAQLAAELEDEDALSALAEERSHDETELTQELGTAPVKTKAPPRPLAFPPDLAFLARWERYRIKRLVGSGGMGTVYKAFDPSLGRNVALKFLHRNDSEQTERFLREARAQARVNHPNVCQVHEAGQVEGRPYIAMQYVKGRSLADMKSRLPVESRVRLIRDVALAIHAAHKNGLIHRDLKPGNILVEAGDAGGLHPYVVDFGLAQDQNDQAALTRTGMITGTPAYLAPEQAQGRPLDRRSDVYSLGVVLYEILGGRPPFTAENPAAVLVRLIQEEPEPLRKHAPSVPQDLETIVMKCLEKDPARRYETARALAEDLGRYLEGEPIEARPASWAYRFGKKVRKHKSLSIVTTAASVTLLVLGAMSLRGYWQAQERQQLAQDFGQRVAKLESGLRMEAFRPLHDISPRKEKLRREIGQIRAEMERLGPPAEGPGHAALGRAYLALHQYETAREHLERAWNAGQRGPKEAEGLGRALGFLYERALVEAGRPRSREDAAAIRQEIDRTFRRPALSYLKEGVREGEPGNPYLAALIAYYEGRYPEAIVKARQAERELEDFYEATQLVAEIYAAQGDEAARAGRYDEALRFYDQAGAVYRQLLREVGSDASLYAGECARQLRSMETESVLGVLKEDRAQSALEDCDLALKVDPELGEALVQKSRIYRIRASQKVRRGQDPSADLSAAVDTAQRAIALNERDALAYNYLAVALRVRANWERETGLDPSASIERAVRAAEKAVEIQPERASSRSDLATVYLEKARSGRGIDPQPVIERAIASCREATQLDSQYLPAYTNLSNAWNALAERQIAQGLDPSAALAKAVAASQRAVNLNPQSPSFQNNLGNAYLTQADYRIQRGSDPRAELALARKAYERALALDPSYQLAIFNLAWTERYMAQALLNQGEDPTQALYRARAALDNALRVNPLDADSFTERARVELIAGLWARRQGQSAAPSFREAEAALQKALELNPENTEAAEALKELAQARR